MKNSSKNEKVSKNKPRNDWEANNIIVRDAFIALLKRNHGRKPTTEEIANETGMSVITVKRHFRTLDVRGLLTEEQKLFRVLSDDVILSIYRAAMKGNPASQKLWFQVVENWSEKNETKHSGELKIENKPPVILKFTRG